MSTDLTFFTNEPNAALVDRFKQTLRAVQFFDVLVGYFRTSGFYHLADSLKSVENIRILVGLNVDRKTFELIDTVRTQTKLDFNSHKDTRNAAMEAVVTEIDASSDEYNTEFGIKKFMYTNGEQAEEIPFFDAVNIFKCDSDSSRMQIPKVYYDFLKKNKEQFDQITLDEIRESDKSRGGRSNEQYVIGTLKVKGFQKHPSFTDEDEEYILTVLEKYSEGVIPKNITKRIKQKIEKEGEALKILAILKREIPGRLLGIRHSDSSSDFISKREVILSEWLMKK